MTNEEIIEWLEGYRHFGVTMHPDDSRMMAQNDLLDLLIEELKED